MNKKNTHLTESWQNRAQKQLKMMDNAASPSEKQLLLESAMLNINLATRLIAMTENIDDSTAQDTVLHNVVGNEEKRSTLKESLRTGFIIM